jgi:antitoxin Xre/MbcA/ParS-like protein
MQPPDREGPLIDGFSTFDLARVCQVEPTIAQAWLDHQDEPSLHAVDRLRVAYTVMSTLERCGVGAPEDRVEWLRHPNSAFGLEAPIDLIARGEAQPVFDYIDRFS